MQGNWDQPQTSTWWMRESPKNNWWIKHGGLEKRSLMCLNFSRKKTKLSITSKLELQPWILNTLLKVSNERSQKPVDKCPLYKVCLLKFYLKKTNCKVKHKDPLPLYICRLSTNISLEWMHFYVFMDLSLVTACFLFFLAFELIVCGYDKLYRTERKHQVTWRAFLKSPLCARNTSCVSKSVIIIWVTWRWRRCRAAGTEAGRWLSDDFSLPLVRLTRGDIEGLFKNWLGMTSLRCECARLSRHRMQVKSGSWV